MLTPKKPLNEKEPELLTKERLKSAVGDIVNLVRLTKRMALKLYLNNPKEDIFVDGTFDPVTLAQIKKESAAVEKGIAMAKLEPCQVCGGEELKPGQTCTVCGGIG